MAPKRDSEVDSTCLPGCPFILVSHLCFLALLLPPHFGGLGQRGRSLPIYRDTRNEADGAVAYPPLPTAWIRTRVHPSVPVGVSLFSGLAVHSARPENKDAWGCYAGAYLYFAFGVGSVVLGVRTWPHLLEKTGVFGRSVARRQSLRGASTLLSVASFLEFPPARPVCLVCLVGCGVVVVRRRCRLGCGVLPRACIAF